MKRVIAMCFVLAGCGGVVADPPGGDSTSTTSEISSTGAAPVVCDVNADCAKGEWCDNPCAPPKDCALRGTCKPLPSSCVKDAECPTGFYCHNPCGGPAACAGAGSCQPLPTTCWTDSDCPTGWKCNSPCPPWTACAVAGVCVAPASN